MAMTNSSDFPNGRNTKTRILLLSPSSVILISSFCSFLSSFFLLSSPSLSSFRSSSFLCNSRRLLLWILLLLLWGRESSCVSFSDVRERALSHLFALGVFFNLLGTIFSATGDNLIRKSFMTSSGRPLDFPTTTTCDDYMKNNERRKGESCMEGDGGRGSGNVSTINTSCEVVGRMSVWRNPYWIFGMLSIAVFNTACGIVALMLSPISMNTSFAGVHILFSMGLAKIWLKEQTRLSDWFGSVLVVVGMVLIVLNTGHDQQFSNLDEFMAVLTKPAAVAFLTFSLGLVMLGIFVSFCEAFFQIMGINSITVALHRFALSGVSGVCGGNISIFAKAILLVVANAPGKFREFLTDWRAYGIVLITAIIAFTQLFFLNMSMQRYKAIYVIPTLNSVLITCGALGGIAVFQEHPSNVGFLFSGLGFVVLGIVALSYGKNLREYEQPINTLLALRNLSNSSNFLRQTTAAVSSIGGAGGGGGEGEILSSSFDSSSMDFDYRTHLMEDSPAFQKGLAKLSSLRPLCLRGALSDNYFANYSTSSLSAAPTNAESAQSSNSICSTCAAIEGRTPTQQYSSSSIGGGGGFTSLSFSSSSYSSSSSSISCVRSSLFCRETTEEVSAPLILNPER